MFYVMFVHGVTYVRVGCTGNVWTTCNGHGQDEHLGARARSRVYMADKAMRDIWVAPWDTADGVLCCCAAGSELKFAC